ncbi:hypothetical protein ACLMYS_003925 [Salmonella enterica]
MKRTIIALALTFTAITAAHAGSVIALNCPISGNVVVEAGDGDDAFTISQGGKDYTLTQRTIRAVKNGKLQTAQGAALESNPAEWRAIIVDNDFEQTMVLRFVRSDSKKPEFCKVSDFQNY